MFLERKHPLEPGKTVEATLQFEKAGTARERLGTLRPRRGPKCPFIASHSAAMNASSFKSTDGQSQGIDLLRMR
jgi:hypothetical protein